MKKIFTWVCCFVLLLTAFQVSASVSITLSAHDSACTRAGDWGVSAAAAVAGPTGLSSYYTTAGGSYVNYSLKGIDEGIYDVYYYGIKFGTTASKAGITVSHEGGIVYGSYNPNEITDKTWIALGSYKFTGDRSDYVRITLPESGGALRDAALKIDLNTTGKMLEMPNKAENKSYETEQEDKTAPITIPEGGSVMLGCKHSSFTKSGGWIESGLPLPTNEKGFYTSSSGNWGKWQPKIEGKGLTVWYLRVAAGSSEDPALIVSVNAGGKTTKSILDFTKGDNDWVALGSYDFTGSGEEYIQIEKQASTSGMVSRLTAIKIGYDTGEDEIEDLYESSVYTGTDKEILQRMSMLIGEGEGITNEYIGKTPTRAQMAALTLRLNGKYEEAEQFDSADNFGDVKEDSWYSAILAYIKANPQLGIVGIGDNLFDPEREIDARSYSKVLLELMGYKLGEDFAWNDTISFANEKGIDVVNEGVFTIDALASATVDALFAKRKGEERTLLGYVVAVREGVDEPIYTNTSVFTEEMKQKRTEAKNKKRTLIYNNDGNDAYKKYDYYPAPFDVSTVTEPMTVENFLSKRTIGIENSQMDSLFYCTGVFNSYTHRSEVAEMRRRDWAPELWKLGTDSVQVMIDWCKENNKEFMWSMRMNDVHDSAYEESELDLWKREHIDMLMSRKAEAAMNLKLGSSNWSGVDYTFKTVRQQVYDILREVVINYDVDGVELDFSRVELYFKEVLQGSDPHPETIELMNDILRKLRTLTEQVSAERGKPILVAVHVPDSLGFAKAIGLDIEQWLREDLIDIVSVRTYGAIQTLAETKAEYEQYDVPLYLVMDPLAWAGSTTFDWNKEAAIAYHEGFTGIQMYNMYNPKSDLFNTLGSVETCGGYDPNYVSTFNPYTRVGNYANDGINRFLTFGQ